MIKINHGGVQMEQTFTQEEREKILKEPLPSSLNAEQIVTYLFNLTEKVYDPKTINYRLKLLYSKVGGRVNNLDFFEISDDTVIEPFQKLSDSFPPFKISSRIIRPVLLFVSFTYFDKRVTTSKENRRKKLNDTLKENMKIFFPAEQYAAIKCDTEFLNTVKLDGCETPFIKAFAQLMQMIFVSTHISRMAMLKSATTHLRRLTVAFGSCKQSIALKQLLECSKPEDCGEGSLIGARNAQSLGDYFMSKIVMASQNDCDFIETLNISDQDEAARFEEKNKKWMEELFSEKVIYEPDKVDAYLISMQYSCFENPEKLFALLQRIQKALESDPEIDEAVVRYLVNSFRQTFMNVGACGSTKDFAEEYVESCIKSYGYGK
ncbi:MAG: hypothetical protein RSE08_08245 [Lactococcus sp.]